MPLPFAILAGVLFGLAFAIMAKGEAGEARGSTSRAYLLTIGFAVFVFAPIVAYFVAFHGDWAYLYLFAWQRVPSAIDLALIALSAAAIPFSFRLAANSVARGRRDRIIRIALPISLVAIGFAIGWEKRLSVSATYIQFHGAFGGVPIGQSSLGRGVLLAWLALAAGTTLWIRLVRKGNAF